MKLILGCLLAVSAFSQVQGVYTGQLGVASGGTVATPTDSPGAGTYGTTQSVTLSDATGSSVICYTINGTTPGAATPGTCDSSPTTTYSTAISVASTTTIKAIGTKTGLTNSGVLTSAYTITTPTLISSSCQALGSGGGTTTGINTTGATMIIGYVTYFGSTQPTIADSVSSTNNGAPTVLTKYIASGNNPVGMFFYWPAPAHAGSGHTFTLTGLTTSPTVCMEAWTGYVGTFDTGKDVGTTVVNVACAPGSFTPDATFPLVITATGMGGATGGTWAVNGSVTQDNFIAATSGVYGVAIGTLVQGSPASIAPTWTLSGHSGSPAQACAMAAFK